MNSQVIVKMYPAQNGDCFLISFRDSNNQLKHLLIDCGYVDTFKMYLKNDLLQISNSCEVLEKLIITHIDADHIEGAISLLKDNNSEHFIEIKEVWHNTYRHLFERKNDEIFKKHERILQQIIQRGYPKNVIKQGEQIISAKQGTTVGALLLQGKYSWNTDFSEQAVNINHAMEIKIDSEAQIYLLSPDTEKLEKLKNFWKNELKKYGVNYNSDSELYDDAFEMLIAWEKEKATKAHKQISFEKETIEELLKKPFDVDNTATNGSSIAFILKIRKKKLLFLADAHPDLIVKSLKKYQEEETIIFDLIKVSHHGSFNNINQELLDKIDSEKYLISTNGKKHNHPHKETIAHIVHRRADLHRKLYFNYVTNNSEYFNKVDWMLKYNYSIHYLNQAPFTLEL